MYVVQRTMRKARRKGLSLRGDMSLATVPLRGLLGAFTMRPPRRSSIWLVLTLRPRNVCNKRTPGRARPNGHQRKRKSACGVYSYGVPRHSWMIDLRAPYNGGSMKKITLLCGFVLAEASLAFYSRATEQQQGS